MFEYHEGLAKTNEWKSEEEIMMDGIIAQFVFNIRSDAILNTNHLTYAMLKS